MKSLVNIFVLVGILQASQSWGTTSQGMCTGLVDPDFAPAICMEHKSATSYFDDTMVDGCFWIGADNKPFNVEAYVCIEKFKNKFFSDDAISKCHNTKIRNEFKQCLSQNAQEISGLGVNDLLSLSLSQINRGSYQNATAILKQLKKLIENK